MDSLPVLDISVFLDEPDSAAGRAFVDELLRTEHDIGFCHLVGHGIDPALEAQVMELAAAFFSLPEPDRLEIVNTNTPHFRGYTRLGQEHTNGTSDWRDQIDIGPERVAPPLGPDAPPWLRLRGPNQWPSAVPEMQNVVTAWMDAMAELGGAVLSALALGLGMPADHFAPVVTPDPEVLVKIIRYPAQDADDDTGQGVGLHHDSGLLSFIMQDDVGGLQVQLGDALVDATPMAGAYVLNLGEMLQVATDGFLRATRHRVVSPPARRQRISVAYFFNPCMEARLDPISLPPELAAQAPGGQNPSSDDPIFATYGENWLKFRLRSHPDVAEIWHGDLIGRRSVAP